MDAPPPIPPGQAPYGEPASAPKRPPAHWWIIGGIAFCGCCGLPIIGALLFPVFAQARQTALKTECVAAVKQVAFAQFMYSEGHDGVFPPAATWMDSTADLVPSEHVFHCPKLRSEGYGYARSERLPNRTSEVKSPSSTIMIFETANLLRNVVGDPAEPPTNRHLNGRTEAYADGSVKFVQSPR